MRQLASIQRIRALEPIENADAIVKATVLGWQLVVKKGEFQVGDLCIYCEIDCLMPNRPEFEFLKPRGMRVRTIRLRGQISQGICLPLSFLPENAPNTEGSDVTDILGIVKYEPPIPASLAGIMKGNFPSFIPKTDETRVQVLEDLLSRYKGKKCFVTEKLDGSSATYFIKDGVFGVCSRNLELLESDDNTYWKLARALDIENKLRSLDGNFAIQGELIGEGIQGNKYALKGQKLYFFNVFNIDTYAFLGFDDFKNTLEKLDLNIVPILENDYLLDNNIPKLVEKALGKSVLKADVIREGIVIRPLVESNDAIGRVSFKSINPEFLLKYNDD
jgi:RNA ligase (TIGR02306 family)